MNFRILAEPTDRPESTTDHASANDKKGEHTLPRSPEEMLDAIEAAVNAHDLDTFIALHEPDAAVVVPPEGKVRAAGHHAIRRALEPLFAKQPSADVNVIDVLHSNGTAMTHTHFAVTITDEHGNRVKNHGIGTVVTRKQPNGTWLIVFDYPLHV